jgi:dipeptidase E
MRRLLLLSNSRDEQGRYLHHPREAMAEHFAGVREVLFVPFAGVTVSWDDYAARVREAFGALGIAVRAVHDVDDPHGAVANAEAIAVGGGNTFHLLAQLYLTGLLGAIRARARDGVPYLGWSAGSVVACPTIRTTNDMPIVAPPSLDALGLIRCQINAHFTDAHPPGFQGETRRERLAEFVVANPRLPAIGLPEGSWLDVRGDAASLGGPNAAFVFSPDGARALAPGGDVSDLV